MLFKFSFMANIDRMHNYAMMRCNILMACCCRMFFYELAAADGHLFININKQILDLVCHWLTKYTEFSLGGVVACVHAPNIRCISPVMIRRTRHNGCSGSISSQCVLVMMRITFVSAPSNVPLGELEALDTMKIPFYNGYTDINYS